VREHFASPLLQFADKDQGKTFDLIECPSGTGQVITRFNNGEIDIAIALTDPLLAGIAKGITSYKLVGSYVTTPLRWAVITGSNTRYSSIGDLRNTTLGISRQGSGSQTMATVMALQQGWVDRETNTVEDLKFQINNDIIGLNRSVNDGSTSAFLWEWFTTKPWADSGEVKFIGSVPTPWPSWMIAAHTSPARSPPEAVKAFLAGLTDHVRTFSANETAVNVAFIKDRFGYKEDDIREWLTTVGFTHDTSEVEESTIVKTLGVLRQANIVPVSTSLRASDYIDEGLARLVPSI